MINIAICDDDNNICVQLENILIEYLKNCYLKFNIDIFYDGQEFIKHLDNENIYDIVFLDIEIGNLTGLDIGIYIRENLQNEILKIIYISSYTTYAMKLFKVRPTDFLLKPINKDEVIKLIKLLIKLLNVHYEYFEFNLEFNNIKVYLKDIIYFNKIKSSRKIVLKTTSKEFIFYGKIKDIYMNLKDKRFIKPFNSYIVNYDYVNFIDKDKLILTNGEKIPISRDNFKEVKSCQIKFLREI